MTVPILSANNWKSNAELIEDAASLGYLRKEWLTLDPTYGKGVWWKKFRPDRLVTSDLKIDGTDFRNLPWRDKLFKASVFDPPYVSTGGRETSTLDAFNEAYGLTDAPKSPEELQKLICMGLEEVVRVTDGYVLVKACNYVSSGHRFPGVYETQAFIYDYLGLNIVDEFVFYKPKPRPQPARRRKDGKPSVQKHARNNYSVLMVVDTKGK